MANTTTLNQQIQAFPVSDPTLSWFVVYTKTQAEKKTSERLQRAGYEVYLPLVEELKQWSDRKKKIQRPLIASVVFVRCTAVALNGVYTVQGVSRVLRYLGRPAVVQAQEILNLQILLQQSAAPEVQQMQISPGVAIEVQRGPFKGIIGTAVQVLNALRVIIEIKHLGVSFSINVPKSFVKVL
ncbi:MAG: UpxY family transcription antiterminator [Flavobacteriales bacterium]